jgi:predicted nucleic acid-binding protein
MNWVVSDTGPLLHLYEIGAFDLLRNFGVVHVTPMVLHELKGHAPDLFDKGLQGSLLKVSLSLSSKQQAHNWVNAQVLHAGEAEALAYALEVKADGFLTDDTAARSLGETLGLNVRGTLGVVLYAAAKKHLTFVEASQVLSDLEMHSSLWMSAKVKAAARHSLQLIFHSAR